MPQITAARTHHEPRKRLENVPLTRKGVSARRARLSILIGKEAEDVFVVDETAAEALASGEKKMPSCGKGLQSFTMRSRSLETFRTWRHLKDWLESRCVQMTWALPSVS